jgi:tetratricopeptide (TPR) repeat protein
MSDNLETLKLDQAIRLGQKKAKEGMLDEARMVYESILKRFPSNKKAKAGLKALSGKAAVRQTAVQDPPQIWLQPVINLYGQGQLEKALTETEALLLRFPKSVAVYSIRGAILAGLGRLQAAIESYKKALGIRPDFVEAYYNMGVIQKDKGDPGAAIACYKKALEIKPDYAAAYNNMGNALHETGDLEAAIDSFKRAIDIKPDYDDAYNNMGNVLHEQGETEAAIVSYKQALEIRPHDADAYSNLGNVLKENGEFEAAINSYRRALEIRPDYADVCYNMGVALQETGDLEAAKKSYKQALKLKPDDVEFHRNFSLINEYSADDAHFLELQRLEQDGSLDDYEKSQLRFALAKACDDLDDRGKAFVYFREGNALRKRVLGYSIDQDKRLFDRLKATQSMLADHTVSTKEASCTFAPVFIVGMPRSGTTLVEQIISSHSGVTAAGECVDVHRFGGQLAQGDEPASPENILRFRENYLSALRRKSAGAEMVTDKMPHNFRYIPLICAAFPEARIIHVERDAAATCWSNFKHYFATDDLGYSYDLEDVVTYYLLYKDLMERWQGLYADRIYSLNYDKLTVDQEDETRNLIRHLGLEWEETCLSPQKNKRGVRTASQQQVRQGVYEGSSRTWLKYEAFIEDAFDRLG